MTYAFKASNIGKRSNGREIIRDVSFELEPGGFYMLLGENGVGKTTLFRCLLGLTRHTGDVTVTGVAGEYPARTGLAGVLDQNTLYGRWTVRANLHYQLNEPDLRRHPPVTRIIPESLLRAQARHLSTGERKLVMLASALASTPPVILLDEFSNGLDQSYRQLLRDELWRATREDGRIVIATSHDLDVMEGLPTEVGRMSHGTIRNLSKVYATTGSLKDTYATPLE